MWLFVAREDVSARGRQHGWVAARPGRSPMEAESCIEQSRGESAGLGLRWGRAHRQWNTAVRTQVAVAAGSARAVELLARAGGAAANRIADPEGRTAESIAAETGQHWLGALVTKISDGYAEPASPTGSTVSGDATVSEGDATVSEGDAAVSEAGSDSAPSPMASGGAARDADPEPGPPRVITTDRGSGSAKQWWCDVCGAMQQTTVDEHNRSIGHQVLRRRQPA